MNATGVVMTAAIKNVRRQVRKRNWLKQLRRQERAKIRSQKTAKIQKVGKQMGKVIVIGAGASGMMAAAAASGNNEVLVLEQLPEAGKKILATGNGKCNFTNTNVAESDFHGNSDFAMKVYNRFNNRDTIAFFEKAGIKCRVREGMCYPYSFQAKAVRDALTALLYRKAVTIEYERKVTSVAVKDNGFNVMCGNESYSCDKLIVATGGKAVKSLGSTGFGYDIAKSFGHKIIKVKPGLTRLYIKENIKELKGVRCIASVSANGIDIETGEIIFLEDSVSGIPVMQLSSLFEGRKLYIDFFPDMRKEELKNELLRRTQEISVKTHRILIGLLNEKLAAYIAKDMKLADAAKLAGMLKSFELEVTGTGDFEDCQICTGGVDVSEIYPETMESKLHRGLYFAGEIVDVDGRCGGYNLQWAWSSGYVAGKSS